jgi:hypothetical protein
MVYPSEIKVCNFIDVSVKLVTASINNMQNLYCGSKNVKIGCTLGPNVACVQNWSYVGKLGFWMD